MLTEGEFKVIKGLRTNTGDYTIGGEKSLLVPTTWYVAAWFNEYSFTIELFSINDVL